MNAIVYLAIQFYTLLSKLSIRKLYAVGDVISWLIGHAPIHEEMLEKIEQAFPDTEASWRHELIKKLLANWKGIYYGFMLMIDLIVQFV